MVSLLYQTIGLRPEKTVLRLKLAQNLYDLNLFGDAQKQAEMLAAEISKIPEDARKDGTRDATLKLAIAAGRIKALAMQAQVRPGGDVTIIDAVDALEQAREDNPADAIVASYTATAYREHAEEVGPERTAEAADQIMDELVDADPTNVDALLARYVYRARYHPDLARIDLDAALKVAPQNVSALLLDVEATLTNRDTTRLADATKNAQKVIDQLPEDPRGYMALAKVCVAESNGKGAIAALQEGRKKVAAPYLELSYALARLLLEANDLRAAEEVNDEFAANAEQLLPFQQCADRIRIENMSHLLKGQLALAKNDIQQAVDSLEAIVASADQVGDVRESMESRIAYDLLANINARRGRPDLAATYWTALADRTPGFGQAALKAGLVNLELGKTDTAVAQIEEYLKQQDAVPEAKLSLMQAQLQQQLLRPINSRNWTGFQQTLTATRQSLPDRTEWKLSEIIYLLSLGTDDAKADAKDRINELEPLATKDENLCQRLILLQLQMGDVAGAEQLLETCEKLQPNESRRIILRSALLAASNRVPQAIELLEQASAKGSPKEQFELAGARLKLLLATQQWDRAQKLNSELIAGHPKDPKLLTNGIEIALRRQDVKNAAELVEALEDLREADDFDQRYFKARLKVATFGKADATGRNEAESLVESLRSERPNWPPVVTLAGELAEVQERRSDAIGIYQSSLKMGDRRSETVERLVRLLFAEGRFTEANEYVAQLKAQGALPSKFESMAIASAIQGDRLDEAKALAEDAVKRGSKDPAHYIMLASIYHQDANKELAESTLRTAVREFPKDGRVWNAVFLYFIQIGQQDRAKQALERWAEQVPNQESEKLLILGQGSEALGDLAAAQAYYRRAVESNGGDSTARFLLAKSLVSTDMHAAMDELDELLDRSPNHAVARRLQASLLATTGDAKDWAKALSLLEGAKDETLLDPAGDERLRALLLSRKGKDRDERMSNYRAAHKILANRVVSVESSDDPSVDIDRILLAGICEQEANLTDDVKSKIQLFKLARETFQPVVDRPGVSAEQLVSYIQFLLRHIGDEKLSGVDEQDEATIRQVFRDDARERINTLSQLLSKDSDSPDKRLLPVAMRMKLFQAEGKPSEGIAALNSFVNSQLAKAKSDTERGKLLLQAGQLCASVGEFSTAEEWFRQLEKIAPQSYILVAQSLVEQQKSEEAVRLCLQVMGSKPNAAGATVIAQILTSEEVPSELERQALRAIDDALDADRGNLSLLMSNAVLRTTRNENDEAIRLFRRVVEIQPRHALALNNLATLLSERPEQLKEAQQFVEKAIDTSGANQPYWIRLARFYFARGNSNPPSWRWKKRSQVARTTLATISTSPRPTTAMASR